MDNIEIVTVHYNTPDLLMILYDSIRKFLPKDLLFRVIDGSEMIHDEFIELEKKDPFFQFKRLGYNIHHGNGMHYALAHSEKEYVLIIDSDAIILKKGLIDEMMKLMKDETYAVGGICKTNPNGINVDSVDSFILYLHPRCMLINLKNYFEYAKLTNHGAPCICAMNDINKKMKWDVLVNFNELDDYVYEKGRGTVARFGYGLGRKSDIAIFNKVYPIINIPLRTSGRPNYFKSCVDSVFGQSYKNINLIVSVDDQQSENYVKQCGIRNIIRVKREIDPTKKTYFDDQIGRTRRYAPYNLYLNELYKHLKPGFIVGINNDDAFAISEAIKIIVYNIENEDQLIFWKVQFPNGQIIPSDKSWGGKPVCCDFSGLGFSFSTKYAKECYMG